MYDRLTLATATGLPFLSLAFHVTAGLTAIVAGYAAIAVRKGGTLHRKSGLLFVYAMVAMGLVAVGISVYEGKESVGGGAVAAYLVFTGYTTVSPLRRGGRPVDIALMLLAFTLAAAGYALGFTALGRPGNTIEGAPAAMTFFITTILLLAALGDAKMIRDRGIAGARRLARRLWRMSFGLFIAAGSFFLGQMKFVPAPIRSVPLLFVLALTPLAVLLYWMWRVRLRQNLRGMIAAKAIAAVRPA